MKAHQEQSLKTKHLEEARDHQRNLESMQEGQGGANDWSNADEEKIGEDEEDREREEDSEDKEEVWQQGNAQPTLRVRSRPPVPRQDKHQNMLALRPQQRGQEIVAVEQTWPQPRPRPKSGGQTRAQHQRLLERPQGLNHMDTIQVGLAEQLLEEQRKQLLKEQWPVRPTHRSVRRARSVVQLTPVFTADHIADHNMRLPSLQPSLQRGLPCLQSSPMLTHERWGEGQQQMQPLRWSEGSRPRSAVPTRSRWVPGSRPRSAVPMHMQ